MLLRSLWHAISVSENQYYTKTADLVTFTEEILNRKLHFLGSAVLKISYVALITASFNDENSKFKNLKKLH